MTCFVGEKWEVTPYHAWSGMAWVLTGALVFAAVWTRDERFAWSGLFATGVVMTYNICASNKAAATTQREAFELGRQHERRQSQERDVPRLR